MPVNQFAPGWSAALRKLLSGCPTGMPEVDVLKPLISVHRGLLGINHIDHDPRGSRYYLPATVRLLVDRTGGLEPAPQVIRPCCGSRASPCRAK